MVNTNPIAAVTMTARLGCAFSAMYVPSPEAENSVAPFSPMSQPKAEDAFAAESCVTFADVKALPSAENSRLNSPADGDEGSASYRRT